MRAKGEGEREGQCYKERRIRLRMDAVELCHQLRDDPVHHAARVARRAAARREGVHLVEEDDARRRRPRPRKQLANLPLRLTNIPGLGRRLGQRLQAKARARGRALGSREHAHLRARRAYRRGWGLG